jgi:hypothetical protein
VGKSENPLLAVGVPKSRSSGAKKESGRSGLKAKTDALFKRVAEREPFWFVKVGGGKYQRSGLPDYIVCFDGLFGSIELKREGKTATPLQEREGVKIHKAGGVNWLADSVEQVEAFLDHLRRVSMELLPDDVTMAAVHQKAVIDSVDDGENRVEKSSLYVL